MAHQALASMAGLGGAYQAVLDGSRRVSGATGLAGGSNSRGPVTRRGCLSVRCQQPPVAEPETGRRAVLGLVAAGFLSVSFVRATLAVEPKPIKVGPPPPPSGGLPGTLNSDEARDFELPLQKRFFLQQLPPSEAAARAKESARDIVGVKELIDKKQWPFVQNDLRLKAGYLRFDLDTVISSKPREEKKALKDLTGKLYQTITDLDYAAKNKDISAAQKHYAATVSSLNDVLAKLG